MSPPPSLSIIYHNSDDPVRLHGGVVPVMALLYGRLPGFSPCLPVSPLTSLDLDYPHRVVDRQRCRDLSVDLVSVDLLYNWGTAHPLIKGLYQHTTLVDPLKLWQFTDPTWVRVHVLLETPTVPGIHKGSSSTQTLGDHVPFRTGRGRD